MRDLGILIITYNRPEDTLALLESLAAQRNLREHVAEILLLNNASTASYAQVEDYIAAHPELPVTYIPHNENLGVARGRNFLIQKAKAKYLLMLDDDMEFDDVQAIETTAGLFLKPQYIENNTAIITVDVFYYATRERQRSAFPHKDMERYLHKSWFLTYYFSGGAHLVLRELFDKTGLYPTDFFYGMEEYDLSYRTINLGYTLAYDNSVKLLHKESPKGRVTNKEKLGMMWVNKTKVAWRYLPKRYFYSTALMWSLQYLKKTGFDLAGMFRFWGKVLKVPRAEQRTPISAQALQYLKAQNARLWY